jgi:flagellar L-ring protein precursor FlgH
MFGKKMVKQNIALSVSIGLSVALLSGCSAKLTDPEIAFEPPKYVEQMPAKEEERNFAAQGSIFGQGDNPLFSDHKAMKVNDIVTVIISEAAKSSNTGSKQLSESDTSSLGGGVFANAGGNGMVGGLTNRVNGFTNTSFTSSSSSTYKGQGSAVKDASFTTTISARIVKVLKNGNYFISGKREILIDNQKQIVQLTGVIRPYDIDQNNNINSTQISDAKILYKTQGDVDRSTQQGWGTKIIQAVWPF